MLNQFIANDGYTAFKIYRHHQITNSISCSMLNLHFALDININSLDCTSRRLLLVYTWNISATLNFIVSRRRESVF